MKSRQFVVSVLLVLSQMASADDHDLLITDIWIREAPPTQNILAGYMQIKNDSDTPRRIVGVGSPAFGSIEIHKTVIRDDVARMEAQPALAIPALDTTILEPGGLHLMLIDPQQPLRAGDKIRLELQIEPGRTQTVTAEVRRGDSTLPDHSHHHH